MRFLFADLQSTALQPAEASMLNHPAVAGITLFARNFETKAQLIALTKSVRAIKQNIIIAVDHEGGRVQRFSQDFTVVPPMRQLLRSAKGDMQQAQAWAQEIGWLMASELIEVGIDLTFAPVLDRDGVSEVIGHRAFSDQVSEIAPLASALISGFSEAGMVSCGKHYPGHGGVVADTHKAVAIDTRSYEELESEEMLPFQTLIEAKKLVSVMPAHVVFSEVDSVPTGFSSVWLQAILRQRLGFEGVVFSDDLSMQAAKSYGSPVACVEAAFDAGCDIALLCNEPQTVAEVLQAYAWPKAQSEAKLEQLRVTHLYAGIANKKRHTQAQKLCADLVQDAQTNASA